LQFYARLKKVAPSRPDEVLAEVGMAEHANKRIRELSGGMKQRIALAAALLADPPILVLDEMTSNLDQAGRSGFLRLLAELKARGKTILFTSHRLDEVGLLADRVVVLERGRVRAVCAPAELPATLGLTATLRIRVDRAALAAATAALRAESFAPSVNGGPDVRVRVPFDRKLDVLRALDRAGVEALDFEIETEGLMTDEERATDPAREA
jgi:ABC-type multidrug transport system ATPase subunit